MNIFDPKSTISSIVDGTIPKLKVLFIYLQLWHHLLTTYVEDHLFIRTTLTVLEVKKQRILKLRRSLMLITLIIIFDGFEGVRSTLLYVLLSDTTLTIYLDG